MLPPAGCETRMILVWASGSEALGTSRAASRRLARALARSLEARITVLRYSFDGEQIYPSAVTDMYQAVERAKASSPSGLPIVGVGGDGFGAAMAVTTAQLARRYGTPEIGFQILLAPILDARMCSPSWKRDRSGSIKARLDAALCRAAPGLDRGDMLLSPLLAGDHREAPPTVVVTTEEDPFRDDGERYARALRLAGVPVWGHRYDGMNHVVATDGGVSDAGLRVVSGLASAVSAGLTIYDHETPNDSSRQNDVSLGIPS